jgi:hypothetical protein
VLISGDDDFGIPGFGALYEFVVIRIFFDD